MKTKENDISEKQMASIHIAYRDFAKLLNEAGYDIKRAIEEGLIGSMGIPFTEQNIKHIFGHTIIKALYPEKFEDPNAPKHPRLTTVETQAVFEVLNNVMGTKFGVSMDFPHREEKQ